MVMNTILYILRTGSPWRDLPHVYGPLVTCCHRCNRWSKDGTWPDIPEAAGAYNDCGDAKIGSGRGGWSTKVHVEVDAKGRLKDVDLTGGRAANCRSTIDLLDDPGANMDVIGDKACDSDDIINHIVDAGAGVGILPGNNRVVQREHNRETCRKRNIAERFIRRIKEMRQIATRCDKTACNFLANVIMAATRYLLRDLARI